MRHIAFEIICAVGFAFGILLMWPVLGPSIGVLLNPTSTSKADDCAEMASVMAQKLVSQQLKAPKSASFPWRTDEYSVRRSDRGTWIVSSYVDAQNSFGAETRTSWTIEMERSGNQWRVVPAVQ